MATAVPTVVTTNRGEVGWRYVGPDGRGVVLEVLAVETDAGNLLVIHAMPQALRGGD